VFREFVHVQLPDYASIVMVGGAAMVVAVVPLSGANELK
jgi:hypothetical protein